MRTYNIERVCERLSQKVSFYLEEKCHLEKRNMSLYASADAGDLARVTMLVEQGEDKNQIGGEWRDTVLGVAARRNHFGVVKYLMEQGAAMDKADSTTGWTPLVNAAWKGNFHVARYLLEQGADRDKSTNYILESIRVNLDYLIL